MIGRREVLAVAALGAAGLGAAGLAGMARAQTAGPRAWLAEQGRGRAFIMGFAETNEDIWFTPTVRAAFDASDTLWVETPPIDPSAPPPSSPSPIVQQLGYDREHNLFDMLGPELAARTRELAASLQVEEARLAPSRPWLAYYVLNGAYRSRHAMPQFTSAPEQTLIARARARSKPIRSEFPDSDSLLRFFAAMPDEAQRDYIRSLLDYIAEEEAGHPVANLDWVRGEPSDVNIDRMRTTTPALYEQMHVLRNRAWGTRIQGLLAAGGRPFILLGLTHILGPDSVPRNLERLGIPFHRA